MQHKKWIVGGLLLVVIAGVYAQTARFDFLNYDDQAVVSRNQFVQHPFSTTSIKWALSTSHSGYWFPVTLFSHMLVWWLFGDWAGGHHLINVLLHGINAMLLWTLLQRMTGSPWRCWIVAALFALHPLAVESVAWIAERKNVLSTTFWLLTTLVYVGFTRRRGIGQYVLMLVLFALGLATKPMLVTLPCTLLLLDHWPLQRRETWRQLIVEKLPLFGIVVVICVTTFLSQRGQGAMAENEWLPLTARGANALVSYATYLQKMVWPIDLAPLYPHPYLFGERAGWPAPRVIVATIVIVLLSAIFLVYGRRRRYLAVGWLWLLGTIAPVSGLLQVGQQAMADRYTYIGLIGVYVLIVWSIADQIQTRARLRLPAIGLTLIVLASLSAVTFTQIKHWHNTLTLFTHTLAVTRENATAHTLIAEELLLIGRPDQAAHHYRKAVQFNPSDHKAHNALGVLLHKRGRTDQAVDLWERAIAIDPARPDPYANLGDIYRQEGDVDRAVAAYLAAVERMPRHWTSPGQIRISNSAAWLLATHQLPNEPPGLAVQLALANARRTRFADPDLLNTLAAAYADAGRFDKAVQFGDAASQLAQKLGRTDLLEQLNANRRQYVADLPLRIDIKPHVAPGTGLP